MTTKSKIPTEERMVEFIKGPALEAVSGRMKRYTLLRETNNRSKNRPRVDLVVPEGRGTPLASIRRNPDGTVSHFYCGKQFVPSTIYNFTPDSVNIAGDVRSAVQKDLLLYAYRNGFKRALRSNPCLHDMHDLTKALYHACDQITDEKVEGIEVVVSGRNGSRAQKPLRLTQLLTECHAAVERSIIEPHRFQEMIDLCGHHTNSVVAYNTTIVSRDVLRELRRVAPNAMWYWQKYISRNAFREAEKKGEPVIKFHHIGDVIRSVRRHSNLSGAAWRAFLAAPVQPLDDIVRWSPYQIECTFKAIGAANRPDASTMVVANACRSVSHTKMHDSRNNHAFEDGKTPWDKWTSALSQYLTVMPQVECQTLDDRQPGFVSFLLRRPENETAARTLDGMADAILFHAQYLMPWGPGNWETLVHRTERWHTERDAFMARMRAQEAERYRIEQEERAKATWESLVEPYQDGNVYVRPITSGRAMIDLGARMGNCLASGRFTDESIADTGRIFAVEKEGSVVGAVELQRRSSRWSLGQVEGPGNHNKTSDLRRIADNILNRYQEATNKNQAKEQVV